MTQIAILVAAYNAVSTLPKCLDSLCNQTLEDIEIICVDDCSTDDTFSLLCQRSAEDSRIKVLQTAENCGQAVARNLALERVTAPYVCMVDADDWLSSDALERAVDIFNTYPSTDSVVFRLNRVYDDGRQEEWTLPQAFNGGAPVAGLDAFEYCMDGWKLHGLYAVRTSLHRLIPFDTATRLYSDDNTSRLHYLHSREVRTCEGIYFYRQHDASMTKSFNIHRFDYMEANLSLRSALLKENIRTDIMQRFEGHRWMTFIACYRLYLSHRDIIPIKDRDALRHRFDTILHTFQRSRLLFRYRWKPGYMLVSDLNSFDFQQRCYQMLHHFF